MSSQFPKLAELTRSNESFYQRVRKILPKDYIEEARKIETEQDLRDFVNRRIAEAEEKKREVEGKRKHGIHKVGKVSTEFQDRLAKILTGYSGIVSLVQTAGGRYGSIAYGSLSVILAVAVNKSNIELKLENGLCAFGQGIDRVTEISHLINDPAALGHLDCALAHVIEFAREATKYYGSSLKRHIYVLIVPTTRLDELQALITREVNEIKDAARLWSLKKLDSLNHAAEEHRREMALLRNQHRDAMDALHKENASLRSVLEERERSFDRQRLLEVEEILKVEEIPLRELQIYERNLRDPGILSKYERFDFKLLKKQQPFKDWTECDRSALFILHGLTLKAGRDNSDKFWASTAVFDLYKTLDRHASLVIYYFIQLEDWMIQDVPAHKIFTSLIWQILKQHPHLLRGTVYGEIKKLAGSKDWETNEPRLPCTIMKQLFPHLPPTFILLDRIDRCACEPSLLIGSLLGMTKDCKGVKIFATFGDRSRRVLNLKNIDLTGVEDLFMHVRLDQRKGRNNIEAMEESTTV